MNHLSVLTFRGLPLPGTLRKAAKTEGSYRALYDKGFIPSLVILLCAVFQGIFNSFAISSIVIPCILPLSVILAVFLTNVDTICHIDNILKEIKILKKSEIICRNVLTNIIYVDIIRHIRQTKKALQALGG